MSTSFQDHFGPVAGHYAQFRPLYPPALFEHLAQLPPARALAWDCACGNGQASLALAAWFDRVIATDGSAAQIASASPHPRVEYRVAPAEDSGLTEQSVDLITVAQALHWFDLERFHAEVRRVLRPGGVLAVWSYGRLEVAGDAVNAQVQRFYRDIIAGYWPPGREHVDNGYADLRFPFPTLPVQAFNIIEHWSLARLAGYVRSWSATARYLRQHGHDPVSALTEELAPLWGDPGTPREIRWPITLRTGRLA